MYEFIVLGLIPGTQIQINFETWQQIAGVVCVTAALWRIHRSHIVRNNIIAGFAVIEMRRKSHVVQAY